MTDWLDPASWQSGNVPGVTDVAMIVRDMTLSGIVTVAGVHVAPGVTLSFDPDVSCKITTTGNVVAP